MPTQWFLDQARQHGRFQLDLFDLADISLPAALPPSNAELSQTSRRPPHLVELAGRLDAADAFVVVTPEYNHSYPASLKHFIDWHYSEWQAKPVGFVSYGGLAGGQRAVEHLRQVFAELHAVTVRDTISFDRYWERFDEQGQLTDPADANAAAIVLLDQLAWWGGVLHDARLKEPYRPAA